MPEVQPLSASTEPCDMLARCRTRSSSSTPIPTTRRCSPPGRWRSSQRRVTGWCWWSRRPARRAWLRTELRADGAAGRPPAGGAARPRRDGARGEPARGARVRRLRARRRADARRRPPGSLPRLADADVDTVAARVAEILIAERASVLTSYDAQRRLRAPRPPRRAPHRRGGRAAGRDPGRAGGDGAAGSAAGGRARGQPGAAAVQAGGPRTVGSTRTPRAAEITHCIDVRGQARARRASMRAHASQATADSGPRTLGVFTRIPPPLFGWVFGREWYRQAGGDRRQVADVSPGCSTRWP